jgi:PPM family protein phosphatase
VPPVKRADALVMAARSDPGLLRARNEDAVFADAARGVAVVADGIGGYVGGEVASSMATAQLAARIGIAADDGGPAAAAPGDHLLAAIDAANAGIYYAALDRPQLAGMGTTLVVAWFDDNTLHAAHIGDSRLYRLRGNAFEQLTRDHSLLQEQLDSGMISAEEARHSPNRNLVTRALGVAPVAEPDLGEFPVLAGDIYLLCSDGLTDMVEPEVIGRVLRALGANPEAAADRLVQMANGNGGCDNVSVVVVRVQGDLAASAGWRRKLHGRFA